jgi:hypothetical protein
MGQQSLQDVGAQRIVDELRAGRSVLPVLRDLFRNPGGSTPDSAMFAGAISECLGLVRQAQAGGVKFSFGGRRDIQDRITPGASAMAVRLNRAMGARDLLGMSQEILALAAVVDSIRPSVRFNSPSSAGSFGKVASTSEPIPVQVISMPPRKTDTKFLHDDMGNVTWAGQVSEDVV